MTLVEVMVILAVVVLLAGLLLPVVARGRSRSCRINCVSNLKQIGLAFRMWANDCSGGFPFNMSVTNGGSLEWIESGQVWQHFAVMNKELNTPKILACPTDNERPRAINWSEFTSNAKLSYFVGFDASETRPQSILSGDRNMAVPVDSKTRIVHLTNSSSVEWTSQLHNRIGNLGLGDGSAMQVTTPMLRKSIAAAAPASGQPIRLGIP
jgi:hypothetical protein